MSKKDGPIFFVIGVSGCGKSTIGQLLATARSVPFLDGDDYHSEYNVSKMAAGNPLNDSDRKEWLLTLNTLATKHANTGAVIVCSALKAIYRQLLSDKIEDKVSWILLDGTFEGIHSRLRARKGHFMPASLLKSQFETLERPKDAIVVSITPSPEVIVQDIITQIEED